MRSSSTKVTTHDLVIQQAHAKNLSLNGKKKASSAISGLHNSRFRGRGMDYQESRVYQAGDDIRNMDWLVTARTGSAHTKLFQEERERPIYIVIDKNQSMKFGTKKEFKSVTASKAASLIAWSAVKNGDRVGVLSYGTDGIHHQKPVGGKRGMMKLIAHLVQTDQSTLTNSSSLESALERLRSIVRPGSLVFIISDFYQINENIKRHLIQLNKHNDVLSLFICDPFEFQQIPSGYYGISNNNDKVVLNTSRKSQTRKLEVQQSQHLEKIYQLVQKSGVPVLPIQTNDDLTEKVRQSIKSPFTAWNQWKGSI